MANRERTPCEAVLQVSAPKMDLFKVALSVFIMIITPRDSVPLGRLYFDLTL